VKELLVNGFSPLAITGPVFDKDELVSALQRGDAKRLRAPMSYFTTVCAPSRAACCTTRAPPDLVHETFVTLPSAIRSFRGESALSTFLVGIAVRHARHHVRASARRRSAMRGWRSRPPRVDARRRRSRLRGPSGPRAGPRHGTGCPTISGRCSSCARWTSAPRRRSRRSWARRRAPCARAYFTQSASCVDIWSGGVPMTFENHDDAASRREISTTSCRWRRASFRRQCDTSEVRAPP